MPIARGGLAAGDWVATYAAIVATAALVWNIARYLLEDRTRVEVGASGAFPISSSSGPRIGAAMMFGSLQGSVGMTRNG